ncbi:MAG: T9SS type A sorting domain-containing protein [Candidatus Cloacimonetes bacterium]|nr:T9SS type A sorting domain-containing protein [Candidatus Cloacimonadota bacterium]
MKKALIITSIFIFACSLFALDFQQANYSAPRPQADNRYLEVTYTEDFENGVGQWTTFDGTVPAGMWRTYENNGEMVWWMGDESLAVGNNIGGYLDHTYVVLDTPEFTVNANTLTFDMQYAVEDLGGTTPYDAWDGMNIRVSTDQGANWTVMTPTAPAYNGTSFYSFGFEHGEGAGVPGWGGSSNGWVNASFDMSAYMNTPVMVRFAFASDPGYCTSDDPTLFGAMIDNIVCGTFSNNATSDTGFTMSSLVPLGGDMWHIATSATAPSATQIAACTNDQNQYVPNMLNYLISPTITLPPAGEIWADFQIKTNFRDGDTFPAVDYFGYEISPDDGYTWYAMSNPYGSATGNNYVYTGSETGGLTDWGAMIDSYSLDGRIDDYAGNDVKFRIYFQSDADTPDGDADPDGWGIFIDDFMIYNDIYLPSPYALNGMLTENIEVELNWNSPAAASPEDVTYSNGAWASYVNDAAPYAMKIVNPYDVAVPLQSINFVMYAVSTEVSGTADVMVWEDNAGAPSATPVFTSEDNGNMVHYDWTSINVSEFEYMVPANGTIWVGVGGFDVTDQGLLCDDSSVTPGSYCFSGGIWAALEQNYTTLINVGISATLLVPDPDAYLPDGYDIYHSLDQEMWTSLGTVTGPNNTTYTHMDPSAGVFNYYKVTGIYGNNESDASNVTSVFVLTDDYEYLDATDGMADMGYQVGFNNMMAVYFNHDHVPSIINIGIYVETLGSAPFIIRIFDDVEGVPAATNSFQTTIAAAEITEGLNEIVAPDGMNDQLTQVFEDGKFWIGLLEFSNASQIGLDTNSTGNSMKKIGTAAWQPITEGNVMIRTLVLNGAEGTEEEVLPSIPMTLNNYPNPFNPETKISYSVPVNGHTTLKIYNVKGQLVDTLVDEYKSAGQNDIVWKADNQASGVYFYKLQNGGQTVINKMVLMK